MIYDNDVKANTKEEVKLIVYTKDNRKSITKVAFSGLAKLLRDYLKRNYSIEIILKEN